MTVYFSSSQRYGTNANYDVEDKTNRGQVCRAGKRMFRQSKL